MRMNQYEHIPRKQLISVEDSIKKILLQLNTKGCRALIVGGAVRDAILGITPKDVDIEVYKISYNDLKEFLEKYGVVNLVGKTFGVIKFKPYGGFPETIFSDYEYDFSIPRKENKVGVGHTSFEIKFDLNMSIRDAGLRRDCTFNALSYDPIENKIYDYFGGLDDLKNGIIRHTSEQFKEDSLRILRILQFQSRFNFKIHPDTIKEIRNILETTKDFEDLSKERIFEEWMKFAVKGIRHDLIFDFLRETTLINKYPILKALASCPQDKFYHSEGDVEVHTKKTLLEIDKIIDRENISGNEKMTLVMVLLLHDVGKALTTKNEFKRGRMTITSNGHEALGGEMAKTFLEQLGFHEELIIPICNLIANHLASVSISSIANKSGQLRAVKRLSRRLHPATIQQLLYVIEADHKGRGLKKNVFQRFIFFVKKLFKGDNHATGLKLLSDLSKEINVKHKSYEYFLMGRHLIAEGLKPSPKFREILQKSYDAQENGDFQNLDGAKEWLKKYLQTIE